MALRDGQRVAFAGIPSDDGLGIGDTGKVLACQGDISHVMWNTGRKNGSVTVEDNDDLVAQVSPRTVESTLADSLDDGDLVAVAVRETYDEGGETALLSAMASAGHLASLTSYAEEALSVIALRIRTDPVFQPVLGELEPEEGDALVNLAAAVLMRDAFGTD